MKKCTKACKSIQVCKKVLKFAKLEKCAKLCKSVQKVSYSIKCAKI